MSTFFGLFGKRGHEEKESDLPEELDQREMIEGVEQLSETIVKEVMVPRTDTVFLPLDAGEQDVLSTLVESGHSRIPVYKETIDDVHGILYAKDVLAALIRKEPIDIQRLARKPFFVPETKKIDGLLKEFKRRHVHIAVVVDEYGGTSGIVCMEDIIEEIVGEIQDEFDDEMDEIVSAGDHVWICDARTRLEEIAEATGLAMPEDEYDSLAGYVFDLFGRIPAEKEAVESDAATFTVEQMEGHRMLRVKIELRQPGAQDQAAEEDSAEDS